MGLIHWFFHSFTLDADFEKNIEERSLKSKAAVPIIISIIGHPICLSSSSLCETAENEFSTGQS